MDHLPLSKVTCPPGQQLSLIAKYFNDILSFAFSEITCNEVQQRLTLADNIPPQKLPFKIGGPLASGLEPNKRNPRTS